MPGVDGDPLNLIEACAELVRHHKLTPEAIENLDRWWIAHVYFHPRGKYGELKVSSKPKPAGITNDRKAAFRMACQAVGWPDWLIEHEWEAGCAAAAKAKAERAKTTMEAKRHPPVAVSKPGPEAKGGRQKGRSRG